MRKYLFLAIIYCLLLCGYTKAEEPKWSKFGSSSEAIHFVDKSSIVRKGSVVKFWELDNQVAKQQSADGLSSFLSEIYLREIDCDNKTFKSISITQYSQLFGNGEVVFSSNDDYKPKTRTIPPGTIIDNLKTFICSNY